MSAHTNIIMRIPAACEDEEKLVSQLVCETSFKSHDDVSERDYVDANMPGDTQWCVQWHCDDCQWHCTNINDCTSHPSP